MPKFILTITILISTVLGACANVNTIGRTTTLPDDARGDALAVHLDAQQRLFIHNASYFCAEPSPDALSAYAASLGLGASVPSQGAASFAQALQSTSGSIGLRTQSITLMRDALYRMCEAYNNNVLGPVQVATLLNRSQDLTAVILAVEQLTGAVTAEQVILGGSASSSAMAALVANQELLAQATEIETKRLAELESAKENQATRNAEYNDAVQEAESAKTAYENAAEDSPDKASLRAKLTTRQDELEIAKQNLDAANADVATKEQLLASATEVKEAVETAGNEALTNATAATAGSGQFSTPSRQKTISDEAAQEVAEAVEEMVTAVLEKSYIIDSCMVFLTTRAEGEDADGQAGLLLFEQTKLSTAADRLVTTCTDLIEAHVKAEREKAESEREKVEPTVN